MSKADMNNAIKEVTGAKNELTGVFNSYLEELEQAAAGIEQLEEKLEAAKQEKAEADTLDAAKELSKAVTDLEDELELAGVVNGTRGRKKAAEVTEAAENTMRAYSNAKKVYNEYVNEVKQSVSLNSLKEDNEELKEIAKTVNLTGNYIRTVMLDVGAVTAKDSVYRGDGAQFHFAAAPLHTDLSKVFKPETLRFYKRN